MPLVRCPRCQAVMQVDAPPEDGSLTCILCGGLIEPQRQEQDDLERYVVDQVKEEPHRTQEVQDFVDNVTQRAEQEAVERAKPYKKISRPVGKILGWLLVGGGGLLMLSACTSGGGMMATLVNGILFPIILILLGVTCLMAEKLARG